jgi:ATP-binding cassette, subfamily B, bacterial
VAIHPDQTKGWMARLWPLVRSHRVLFGLAAIAGVVVLALSVTAPAVLKATVDAARDGDRDALNRNVAVLGVIAVLRLLAGSTYRYRLQELAWAVETDLRRLIYEHLTTLSFSYFDRTQSGQVISRANSDIRSIQLLLAFSPLVLLSMLTFVFAFIYMLTIHVLLTLVALSTLPAVYVLGGRLRDTVFPLTWLGQARAAELATIVDENVNGTRVIKAFAAEGRELTLLASAAQRIRWANLESNAARARYNPAIEAMPRLGMAAVLVYGGWLALDGQVTVGALFAFNAYVVLLQAPFRMIGFLLLQTQRASASALRIFEVLDTPPEITDAPDALELVDPTGRIEFRGVTFSYPPGADGQARPEVLSGVDLVVEAGTTVAVVGATGSGKSTIARLISRFYDVSDGAVLIDDHDVRALRLTSLRHHVGVVFDEPFLFSTSLADNIAFGRPDAGRDEIESAARAAQAHGFITDLPDGYDTVVGERGYTLSGGQRQRVALARTLLEDPPILLLDDATSAIDAEVEAAIHDAIRARRAGRTTIVIAHRLSTIALAERVAMLDDGRIIATGTHAELLATEPRYREILAEATGGESGDAGQAGATGESGDAGQAGAIVGNERTVQP